LPDVLDFEKSEHHIDQHDHPEAERGIDAVVTCCVARSSQPTLKCSAHSPATEMPWPSSHVTIAE
jgi:hypothetical protein